MDSNLNVLENKLGVSLEEAAQILRQEDPVAKIPTKNETLHSAVLRLLRNLRADGRWGIHAGHLVSIHKYPYLLQYRQESRLSHEELTWFAMYNGQGLPDFPQETPPVRRGLDSLNL